MVNLVFVCESVLQDVWQQPHAVEEIGLAAQLLLDHSVFIDGQTNSITSHDYSLKVHYSYIWFFIRLPPSIGAFCMLGMIHILIGYSKM